MYALDANVVISALNGRIEAVRARYRSELAAGTPMLVSSIVLTELEYGIARSQRKDDSRRVLDAFLSEGCTLSPFTPADAAIAGEIRGVLARLGTPIGPYDVLIAAHALRCEVTLVTANSREFSRVPGLRIENWAT